MSAAPLFPLAPAVHISGEIPPRPAYPEFVGLPDLPALAAMKAIPQWVAWDYELRFYEAKRGSEPRPPTWSKVPLDPNTDRRAKSSDPATWGTYERAAARARAGKMPGVGFMMAAADGLGGYDLDRVRDPTTGELAPWAAELVVLGEAYAEVSPSGRGVRMFSVTKPATVQKCDPASVEMYRDKRFLTVTGRHLAGSPIDLRRAPRTEAALIERVQEFRKRIAAEREAQREAEGRPQPKPRRTDADGPKSFCAAVNEAAFADMAAWIPTLFSGYGSRTPGGGWRLTPADLDRDDQYEEDLSLDPKGFVDFAVADMGDEREGKRTPIDLVIEWGVLFAHFHEPPNAIEAARWLCEQLDVTPDGLGWKPRSEADHFDAEAAMDVATDRAWSEQAQRDGKGQPIPNLANVMLVLRNVPDVVEAFAHDEMSGLEMLVAPIPAVVPEAQPFTSRALREADYSAIQEWLQRSGLSRIGKETVYQAIDFRAHERAYHPVRDYLNGLVWDRQSRLTRWLTTYLGVEATPYAEEIGRLFLIAMVARIFEPGCKSDYMLILEGDQGTTKSMACAILAGRWFSDSLPDVTEGKDVAQHLVGKWLIEVGELSAMSRAESNQLKAFITRSTERYRPSYGRKEVVQPRQCLFIGTTNKALYLRDETGARRFWPVKTGAIDTDALRRDRDQLFAEAVVNYRLEGRWWPDAAFEAEYIRPQQEGRQEPDAWEDVIRVFLAERTEVLINEVARGALHMTEERIGRIQQNRIISVLERLGWRRSEKKDSKGYWPWRPRAAAG